MERFDICLSYRRSDADRARALASALEAEGVRAYVDDGETLGLLGIQRAVQEHLARARLLAVFLDGSPNDTRIGHWFLAAALLAARTEGDPGRRVVLLRGEGSERLPAPLDGLPILTVPAEPGGLRAVVGQIRARAEAVRGALSSLLPLGRPPWLPGAAFGPDRFVGRHATLHALHALLEADKLAILVGEQRGYGGAGQVGVGRTLLAQEYALRFGAAYPGGIVWLSAYGGAGVPPEVRERLRLDQLRAVARRLGLPVSGVTPAEIEASVGRSIAARNQPVLWVVDDLPEGLEARDRDAWVVPDPLVRRLFIVPSTQPGEAGVLTLGGLARAEAHALVTRSWKPHTPDEDASAWRIVDDLAGQPLALDAAGGVNGVGAGARAHAALRATIRRSDDRARGVAEELFSFVAEAHSLPVAATLVRCVEQLSPEASDLVRLAALLEVAPVDPPLAAAVLAATFGYDLDTATLRTEQGLAQLEQAGVAMRLSADGVLDAPRTIHPMWLLVFQRRDPEGWRVPQIREGLVRVLTQRLSEHPESVGIGELACARLLARQPDDPAVAGLVDAVGRHLLAAGDAEEAERSFRVAHAARERLEGTDSVDALASLEGLAQAAWARGDREEALKTLQEVLASRRERLGDADPSLPPTMDTLARWYLELGRKAESRALMERVLDGRRRTLGNIHPLTLDAVSRLARLQAVDGDLAAAIRASEEVLMRIGRLPDKAHLGALEGVIAVAQELRAGGELAAARRILESANVHLRRLVGADDARLIQAQTLYAKVLVDLDDIGAARRVETDTLAALLRVHGESHPDTLTMMNNLGTTLSAIGELTLARQHLDRAWKLRTTVLGPRHTDTVVTGWNLHSVMNRQGLDSGAVLAELEWLLEARPDGLSPKQRKVREALQDLVRAGEVPPPRGEAGPGWAKALSWVTKPFRRK